MTRAMPLTSHVQDLAMSNTLDESRDDASLMQVDPIGLEITSNPQNSDDEYSDFAVDPEELAIIDELLLQVAAKRNQSQNAPLVTTDIEDYEAPRVVRLPKLLGVETTRQWHPPIQPQESRRDQNGKYNSPDPVALSC